MEEAQLQGAFSHNAQLQGAILEKAQLQGALLVKAQLQGAFLHNTQLQGAILEKAQLQGAILEEAQLQGADLRFAAIGGAAFTAADLSLSDLRQLNRDALLQEDYEQLRKFLLKTITDEKLRTRVLQTIKKAVGQPDNLAQASINRVLCDEEFYTTSQPVFAQAQLPHDSVSLVPYHIIICIPEAHSMDYDADLAPYLRDLGCRNLHIARNLVYRVQEMVEPIRKLRKDLAKALLAPECSGGIALPDSIKQHLQAMRIAACSVSQAQLMKNDHADYSHVYRKGKNLFVNSE